MDLGSMDLRRKASVHKTDEKARRHIPMRQFTNPSIPD